MQSTSSEPSPASSIIRTGIDGRLRYTREQRQDLLEAFGRSGLSAMSFSRQHGVSYQTFIACPGRLAGRLAPRAGWKAAVPRRAPHHERRGGV